VKRLMLIKELKAKKSLSKVLVMLVIISPNFYIKKELKLLESLKKSVVFIIVKVLTHQMLKFIANYI
jgi:hypothetical protein